MYAYIYSRIPYPTCADIAGKLKILKDCGIPPQALINVNHSSCDQKICLPPGPSPSPSQTTTKQYGKKTTQNDYDDDYNDHHGLH